MRSPAQGRTTAMRLQLCLSPTARPCPHESLRQALPPPLVPAPLKPESVPRTRGAACGHTTDFLRRSDVHRVLPSAAVPVLGRRRRQHLPVLQPVAARWLAGPAIGLSRTFAPASGQQARRSDAGSTGSCTTADGARPAVRPYSNDPAPPHPPPAIRCRLPCIGEARRSARRGTCRAVSVRRRGQYAGGATAAARVPLQ